MAFVHTRKKRWRRCRGVCKKQYSPYFSSKDWEPPPTRPSLHASQSWTPTRTMFERQPRPKVSFDDNVRVVRVPSRTDLGLCGMINTIWWRDEDYDEFKSSALNLLLKYGNLHQEDEIECSQSVDPIKEQSSVQESNLLSVDLGPCPEQITMLRP